MEKKIEWRERMIIGSLLDHLWRMIIGSNGERE